MASIGFESLDVHRLDAVVGEFLSETDRVFPKSDVLNTGRLLEVDGIVFRS